MDNVISIGTWKAYSGRGRVPVDDLGCAWTFSEPAGWFGGVDVRSGSVDRQQQDGVYDGPAPLAGRVIQVSGDLHAPTRQALQIAMDRLSGLLTGIVRRDVFVFDEQIIEMKRRALVRLGGATLIQRTGPNDATWSLSLFAPDPLKYSDTLNWYEVSPFVSSGGRSYDRTFPQAYGSSGHAGVVTVTNRGNASTWPVFSFIGPALNPRVRIVGGASIGFIASVDAGRTLLADTGLRTVSIDGTSKRNTMTADSTWFSLPPGDTTLYYENGAGAGRLRVEWRDAWT